MQEHFKRYTVSELTLLEGMGAESFDHLTRLASTMLDAPVSLVSIIDAENDRQFFKSLQGLAEPWATRRETPLSHSFCQYVASDNAMLRVDNAPDHPRVKDNLAIRDLDVIAYLGVPIHDPQGLAVGALCAIDRKPREWSEKEAHTLQRLALCVDDAIRLKSALLTSEEQRVETEGFTHAITHDIRGPIRTLRAVIDELEKFSQAGDLDQHTEFVHVGAQIAARIQRMADDMLEYAVTTQDETNIQAIDLNDLILSIGVDLHSDIKDAGIKINFDGLPTIEGNRTQLHLLFRNLLDNAIKFRSSERSPVIDITSSSSEFADTLTVSDNGIGIAEEDQKQIFGLFQRLHRQAEYKGSGLGLALCNRIVKNMSGSITLESQQGSGSAFHITLPKIKRQ